MILTPYYLLSAPSCARISVMTLHRNPFIVLMFIGLLSSIVPCKLLLVSLFLFMFKFMVSSLVKPSLYFVSVHLWIQ